MENNKRKEDGDDLPHRFSGRLQQPIKTGYFILRHKIAIINYCTRIIKKMNNDTVLLVEKNIDYSENNTANKVIFCIRHKERFFYTYPSPRVVWALVKLIVQLILVEW